MKNLIILLVAFFALSLLTPTKMLAVQSELTIKSELSEKSKSSQVLNRFKFNIAKNLMVANAFKNKVSKWLNKQNESNWNPWIVALVIFLVILIIAIALYYLLSWVLSSPAFLILLIAFLFFTA